MESAIDPVTIPNDVDNNFNKWKQHDVFAFLKVNQEEYDLTDRDIAIIQREQVSGRDFLRMTKKDLLENPYNLPGGVASRIELLINALKQLKCKLPHHNSWFELTSPSWGYRP